jgi:hypothetical protein
VTPALAIRAPQKKPRMRGALSYWEVIGFSLSPITKTSVLIIQAMKLGL